MLAVCLCSKVQCKALLVYAGQGKTGWGRAEQGRRCRGKSCPGATKAIAQALPVPVCNLCRTEMKRQEAQGIARYFILDYCNRKRLQLQRNQSGSCIAYSTYQQHKAYGSTRHVYSQGTGLSPAYSSVPADGIHTTAWPLPHAQHLS